MILTGKAKTHFEKFLHDYLIDNDLQIDREFFPTSLWQTIIIEFFDSVGIYVSVFKDFETFEFYINDDWAGGEETRQEATTEAIIKANYLYNERKI